MVEYSGKTSCAKCNNTGIDEFGGRCYPCRPETESEGISYLWEQLSANDAEISMLKSDRHFEINLLRAELAAAKQRSEEMATELRAMRDALLVIGDERRVTDTDVARCVPNAVQLRDIVNTAQKALALPHAKAAQERMQALEQVAEAARRLWFLTKHGSCEELLLSLSALDRQADAKGDENG